MITFSPGPMIIAKTRRIFRRFEDAGATSPRDAKTLEELGVFHGLIFKKLLRQGVIIEASPQRYYLSHEIKLEYNQGRKTRIKILLLVVAVIIIIAAIYNFIAGR